MYKLVVFAIDDKSEIQGVWLSCICESNMFLKGNSNTIGRKGLIRQIELGGIECVEIREIEILNGIFKYPMMTSATCLPITAWGVFKNQLHPDPILK